MATTKSDIAQWFRTGLEDNKTHLIVVVDTFDHEDYPVYVARDQVARAVADKCNSESMQRVMEVYDLSMSMEDQLNEHRAFHY